jgi:response regulator RpfG family c-di-GMP phosphodiesterase
MLCRVLLVDDDALVLSALRRELLRKPELGTDGIEIEMFTSATAALERAAAADGYFDVAIVDYRMKDMDGLDFLTHLRQLQPEAVRIMLTGAMDMEGAIAAINAARVDHLIAKPWDEFDLKLRIALALHQRELHRHVVAQPAGGAIQTFRLLLVDDEEGVLNALRRELSLQGQATRGAHPLFEIVAVPSPAVALQHAIEHCPDIVIADHAMPMMNGVEFLKNMRLTCPNCVRILMSGRADIGVLTDAINVAGVYHFIGKPWETLALRAAIAEALTYRELLGRNN